ncbi:hypothetical protein KI387_008262, partial [Taxus chinensis]
MASNSGKLLRKLYGVQRISAFSACSFSRNVPSMAPQKDALPNVAAAIAGPNTIDITRQISGALDIISKGAAVRGVMQRQFFHSTPHSQLSAGSGGTINQSEFTEMALEAIVGSVDAARLGKQQIVETEHLMKALLEKKNGLARRIFTKAGIDNTTILQATEQFISQQPKVLGDIASPMLSTNLMSLLDQARVHKKEFGDDFLSVEHLVLAFLKDKRFGQKIFKDLQLTEKVLKDAVQAVRGNQKVTDQMWVSSVSNPIKSDVHLLVGEAKVEYKASEARHKYWVHAHCFKSNYVGCAVVGGSSEGEIRWLEGIISDKLDLLMLVFEPAQRSDLCVDLWYTGAATWVKGDPEGKYEALEKYGKDLTEMAKQGKLDPVIGRDDEIRRCIQILSRRTKNNPVIIGEPGVGKTAIAEG